MSKKKIPGIEGPLETIFMVLFSIIEIFLHLAIPLEMLLETAEGNESRRKVKHNKYREMSPCT